MRRDGHSPDGLVEESSEALPLKIKWGAPKPPIGKKIVSIDRESKYGKITALPPALKMSSSG